MVNIDDGKVDGNGMDIRRDVAIDSSNIKWSQNNYSLGATIGKSPLPLQNGFAW